MPVEIHEVHPSTRQDSTAKYGCNNFKRKETGYWARDLSMRTIPPYSLWTYVHNTHSTECRFDQSLQDAKCEGCKKRGQGEKYDQEIRTKGT